MNGLNMNMMGLLIAHSVAGKKLQGQQRTKALLTSALVPAQGIAGILTPMALTQKEVAEQERRTLQDLRSAESAASLQGKHAANTALQALAEAAASLAKEHPPSARVIRALAAAFSARPEIKELIEKGLVTPIKLADDLGALGNPRLSADPGGNEAALFYQDMRALVPIAGRVLKKFDGVGEDAELATRTPSSVPPK